jgi:serine/threonine-protein kinase
VYDWGEDDGAVYLVTEYLDGGSLRSVLDGGVRLTPSQALLVGLAAARGLDFAHRRGFVHRDIKPANLLFDEDGRLRIADFGLARALAEAAWTEPAGAVVGTARYASPEQARGDRVDGRSDVYSLALVVIEAVTGQVPFAADTTIATLMARVDRPVEVPAELGGLRPLLQRAGRPDPQDRPDAGEFALGLLATAEDLPRPEPLTLVGTGPAGEADDDEDDTTLLTGPPAEAPATADTTAEFRRREVLIEEVDRNDEVDGGELERGRGKRRPKPRRDRPRRWPKVLVAILAVLALAAGAAIAYATLYTPSHEVPDLVGLDEADATDRAEDLGWEVERLEDRQDGTEPGEVIRQVPEAGVDLQEGEPVQLTVSLGPTLTNVPPGLAGQPLTNVQTALETSGLAVGNTTRQFDEDVPTDAVIALASDGTTPPPARLPRGTEIDLVVSQGPAPRRIPAPPPGITFADYAVLLQQQRLVPQRIFEFHDTVPVNQVIRVEPAPGTEVPRDTPVRVAVSKGRAVTVPNVIGRPLAQAITMLQQAGLVIVQTSGNGNVLSTDPGPGAVVTYGTGVRIFASA